MSKLEAVHPDRIEINDRGDIRDLPLHKSDAVSSARRAAPSQPLASAAPAVRAACARPPGFNGPVYKLNAELLAGMVGKPDTWSGLLAPTGDALVVRDETGLAAMLGMKTGDRITQANGIALVSIDDMRDRSRAPAGREPAGARRGNARRHSRASGCS